MLSRDHSALGNAFLCASQLLLHRSLEVLLSCHRITQDGRDLLRRP